MGQILSILWEIVLFCDIWKICIMCRKILVCPKNFLALKAPTTSRFLIIWTWQLCTMAIRSLHGLSANFTLTPPLFKPPRYGPEYKYFFYRVIFRRNLSWMVGFNKTTIYSFGGGNRQRSREVNPFTVHCTQSWLRNLCTKLYFENRQT
jgi:hypothetical protein